MSPCKISVVCIIVRVEWQMIEWVVIVCCLCWIVVFQLELMLLLRICVLLYRVVLPGFVVG